MGVFVLNNQSCVLWRFRLRGKRLLRQWVTAPLTSYDAIVERQRAVTELVVQLEYCLILFYFFFFKKKPFIQEKTRRVTVFNVFPERVYILPLK